MSSHWFFVMGLTSAVAILRYKLSWSHSVSICCKPVCSVFRTNFFLISTCSTAFITIDGFISMTLVSGRFGTVFCRLVCGAQWVSRISKPDIRIINKRLLPIVSGNHLLSLLVFFAFCANKAVSLLFWLYV